MASPAAAFFTVSSALDIHRVLMTLRLGALAIALIVCVVDASVMRAALVHQYTFNAGNASDSVGDADGVLRGTIGSYGDGRLLLPNPIGRIQAADDPRSYVDLPNGIVSSAAAADQAGAVSIEMWIEMKSNRQWAAAFTAGNTTNGIGSNFEAGEDPLGPYGGKRYVQIIPAAGNSDGPFRVTTSGDFGGAGFYERWIDDSDGTLQAGVMEHIVAVFDQSVELPGEMTVYRNGMPIMAGAAFAGHSTGDNSAPIAPRLNLSEFAAVGQPETRVWALEDVNIWLGRSQFSDSLIDAEYDEVRIYSHALDAAEVAANFARGPVPVPEPSAAILAIGLVLALSAILHRTPRTARS